MTTVKRVLVPTDFSELACQALDYAGDLSRHYAAELHVLHVIVPGWGIPVTGADPAVDVPTNSVPVIPTEQMLAEAAELLKVHTRPLDLPIPPVEVVRVGPAWQAIVRYAEEAGIDLTVIGTHARGVVKRILLGSTSKAVLEHAPCPVLMVPLATAGHPKTRFGGAPHAMAGSDRHGI